MSTHCYILGCGPSGGVPKIGGYWGQCDPCTPQNNRKRCSILLEKSSPQGVTRVLIDTSPDLRAQLLSVSCDEIDGVFYTHDHADHTHGIDDLRGLAQHQGRSLPVWANRATCAVLRERFGYCFETPPGSFYTPFLELFPLFPGKPISLSGKGGTLELMPFELIHGTTETLGFRCAGLAYCPDVKEIPPQTAPFLEGLEIWIVDALQHALHPTHFCLQETLAQIAYFKPKRAILTNLHTDMDYKTLKNCLPSSVEPAFDGMILSLVA